MRSEERVFKRLILISGIFLVATGAGFLSHWVFGRSFVTGSGDVFDYAAMGRNLVEGRGFTTSTVYPLQLSPDLPIQKHSLDNPEAIPNLHRPPLWPLWFGLVFSLFETRDALLWGSSWFFGLSALGLIAAQRGFSLWETGIASLTLLFFPPFFRHLTSGLTETAGVFICLAVAFLFPGAVRSRRISFLLGGLLGAAFLLKYYLILLLPAAAVFLWKKETPAGRTSARFILLVFLGWLLVAGGWLVRNERLTGNPFFTIQSLCEITKGVEGFETFRTHRGWQPVDPLEFVWNHPAEIFRKSLASWWVFSRSDFGAHTMVFLIGCLAVFHSLPVRRTFLCFWLGTAGVLVLLLAPVNLEPRYLLCLEIPILIEAIRAVPPKGSPRMKKIFAGTVLFFCLGTLYSGWRNRLAEANGFERDIPILNRTLPSEGFVVTDADSFVAWYTGRTALWLPENEGTWDRIFRTYPVSGVYLQAGRRSPFLRHYESVDGFLEKLDKIFPIRRETPSGGILYSAGGYRQLEN